MSDNPPNRRGRPKGSKNRVKKSGSHEEGDPRYFSAPDGWDDLKRKNSLPDDGGDDFVWQQAVNENRHFNTTMTEEAWDSLDGVKIPDPYMMLLMYDEKVRQGKIHQWQIRVQREWAKPAEYIDEEDEDGNPIVTRVVNRVSLRANNGSGKSQLVVAPCAVWFAMAKKRSRCVITSSSGVQLDRQTGSAIASLARRINEYHSAELFRINYRFLTFLPTRSTIELYATNDEKKAEGYHPHDGGEEFAMIVDEGKTVKPNIYSAISRCNGMTHRLDVSSPGGPEGHFYDICGPNELETGKLFRYKNWKTMRVTWRQCPHLSRDEMREAIDRHGLNSPWFRSAYEALFSATSDFIVVSLDVWNQCIRYAPAPRFVGVRYAGLDLSLGGDETVLSVWHGNKQIALECFQFEDSTDTVEHVKKLINSYRINPTNIAADDGVAGTALIDRLWRDGYRVQRMRNESTAYDNKTFANRGAEMWWNMRRYIEECDLIFLSDAIQQAQMTSRFYKFQEQTGRILLESKREAKKNGHASPDRADAAVLALSLHNYPMFKNVSQRDLKRGTISSQEEIFREISMEKFKYSGIDNAISLIRPNNDDFQYLPDLREL